MIILNEFKECEKIIFIIAIIKFYNNYYKIYNFIIKNYQFYNKYYKIL